MDTKQEMLYWQRGDFLLSWDAFPPIGAILNRGSTGKIRLHLGFLQDYLSLLEIIVLNNRLILGSCDLFAQWDDNLRDHDAVDILLTRYRPVEGDLLSELEQITRKDLQDRGILYPAMIESRTISPREYIEKLLTLSTHLQEEYAQGLTFIEEFERDPSLRHEIVLLDLASRFGVPVSLGEFARKVRSPYALSRNQLKDITLIDEIELSAQRGVMAFLRDSLDKGALEQVKRLEALGVHTVFPRTPISAQILRHSGRPEDLLTVALQLRDEYSDFRSTMCDLEAELLNEEATLERKIKICDELESLASTLWPEEIRSLRKETLELIGLLGALPLSPGPLSLKGVTSLASKLLERPIDHLLSITRRRKVRVMLTARKDFLTAKNWGQKLASIFGVDASVVNEAFERFHRQQLAAQSS